MSIGRLYRKNCKFKKCGVVLLGLVGEERIQRNLFDNTDREKSQRLMRAIDAVNARVDTPLYWAAEGLRKDWHVKFRRRSGKFTTCWSELPEVA